MSSNKVQKPHSRKWLWIILGVVAGVLLISSTSYVVWRNKAVKKPPQTKTISATSTSSTSSTSNIPARFTATYRDVTAGIEFRYDSQKVHVVECEGYTCDYGKENQMPISVSAWTYNKYFAYGTGDAKTFKESYDSIISNVKNKTASKDRYGTIEYYENPAGIGFTSGDSEVMPGIGCEEGWSSYRGNSVFQVTWTLYGCESWALAGWNEDTMAQELKEIIATVRYLSPDELTAKEKDLINFDYLSFFTAGSLIKAEEEKKGKESGALCGAIVSMDITGNVAVDLTITDSACGSGSVYPIVLSANNGYVQQYDLDYPRDRYPKTITDKSYPDTGLTQSAVFDHKLVVAVPVHSQQDDCHLCVTGGAEFIQYSWEGKGFGVSDYKYDENYKWNFESLARNPF